MKGNVYGYARVSTREQNLDRQLDALAGFGEPNMKVICDKASGKDFERTEYQRLLRELKEGDVLVVKSIDRLGRNYAEILEQWHDIIEKKCAIVVLDMPLLDTRKKNEDLTGTLIADIVLQLLSYVAQIERENIRQRQAEGITSAKARGVRFGRPRIARPSCYAAAKKSYERGIITKKEAAARMGVGLSTFNRWLKADAAKSESSVFKNL